MKSKLTLIVAVVVLTLSLAACSSSAPKNVSVDYSSKGKEVTLAVGGTLSVKLEQPVGGQMGWSPEAKVSDVAVIEKVDYKYQPPATVGYPNICAWTFKALRAGKATVYMEVLSGMPGAFRTFTVDVVVK
jgi:hypothetical protein